jgi:hypothetical protein
MTSDWKGELIRECGHNQGLTAGGVLSDQQIIMVSLSNQMDHKPETEVTSTIIWKLVVLPTFRKYMLPSSSKLILYSINRLAFVMETKKVSSNFNYYLEECHAAKVLFLIFSRGRDQVFGANNPACVEAYSGGRATSGWGLSHGKYCFV